MSNHRIPRNIRPIWTPADAVDTAQAFHADIANAERGTRLFSKSRERRARILDAAAVTLLMALMGLLGCALLILSTPKAAAAPADDFDPVSVAYAAHYAGAVCATLMDFPSINGVMGIMSAIEDDGLTTDQAAEAVTLSVADSCPRYLPVLQRFANYGATPSTVVT